ncbi:hypothetical protein SELMODRAFT_86162 [Selaginella moellendorffii]|uniref:Pentacotripeptide-repeat region of PRORP domain-containing protein n=1 Tax=Selaginella moellendorffii TaxID=88036 RepID=D8R6I6_SELML|nr:hypothetical protein SELMODRAFT_86162 [Selaginella moellendorffii]
MEQEGIKPDKIVFVSLIDACSCLGDLRQGMGVHERLHAGGFDIDNSIASGLVNMYRKCGSLTGARSVFNKMDRNDLLSWNALIAGYAEQGDSHEALQVFRWMACEDVVSCTAMISAYVLHACHREALELYFRLEPEGMKSDRVTYLSVLEACSSLTALEQGRAVHASIVSRGLDSDTGLKNSLINLYGKCGSLKDAESLFDCMRCRDLVTWNSMITTYSHHGRDEISLEVFMQMKLDGIQPNDVTFVSMLFVCSHAGLFEDGCKCFGSITADYSMELTVDHYNCVIDLLGRAGNLDEAENLVANLPEPCSVDWMTLLGACRIHGDADRALRTAQRVAELDPDSLAGKVLLSNIYATARDWDDKGEIFT